MSDYIEKSKHPGMTEAAEHHIMHHANGKPLRLDRFNGMNDHALPAELRREPEYRKFARSEL